MVGRQLESSWEVPMDRTNLQERQRLAEEAAEKVMRNVPRIRVEEVISNGDNARPARATGRLTRIIGLA